MKTYRIDYSKDGNRKYAELVASDESKAGEMFSNQYPEINPDDIIGVSANSSSNDYKTSTGIASFVSFLGWITILISVGVIGLAVSEGMQYGRFNPMSLMAIVPMFGIFIGGLFLVVAGQITRATLDNTNYSKQMLDLMKQKQ